MAQKSPHKKSLGKLLDTVEELSPVEVEMVFQKLLNLRASRIAPALDAKQSALLQKINAGLSEKELREMDRLIEKRADESLTEKEYQRIVFLTTKLEKLNVQRMELLVELSSLRKVSVRELMRQLDIQAA